ncbi:SAVED domain-containing protein [Sphingobacterium sp. UBA5670]|uniref:SAVED domain-containing protein n=1 Tax=Sphingobacterium sp. UBA5670 TaxID=1947502 RepID=UPI0025F4AF05|nr:SAVED domain-containing protein [Sphingobacterium sp. UBA5670]
MSVSYIPQAVKFILWGKSAGRCQYRGCNTSLFEDALTKGEFNQSYIAHIVADEPGGPRGHLTRSAELKQDINNLMLLCDTHHRLIDKIDVEGHPESLLIEMKKEHEKRIATCADISHDMQSHIVTYKANVGAHTPMLTYESVRESLLPTHYPAQPAAIDLGLSNSPQRDRNDIFWQTETDNLETQFNEQLRPKLRKNEIKHLSLFAFAPMPLLIKLGTMLNDIQHIDVHQPVRDPKSWNLSNHGEDCEYIVAHPEKPSCPKVALNISLSATITNDRITSVMGEDCSIYTLTIGEPFNDYLKNKSQLASFSVAVRKLLNEIKSKYGSGMELNIFPAMPIATAIEFGRVWMPKADMPLIIFDENTGFKKAIEIKNA